MRKVSILFLGFFILVSCNRISNVVPPYLEKTVQSIQKQYAPDKRLEIFSIRLEKHGDQLFVEGELADRLIKKALLDSLIAKSKGYYEIIDSIKLLPTPEIGNQCYGVVNVGVANFRREASHSSELVTQSLLGTVLKLFKKDRGFYLAQNWDGYLGWVNGASIVRFDSARAQEWKEKVNLVVTSPHSAIYSKKDRESLVVSELCAGSFLVGEGATTDWFRVKMPDGRSGYVPKRDVISKKRYEQKRASRDMIVQTAKLFHGVSYLWGGTSADGFDCSGFVQNVFFLNNIKLPRDANQIVTRGVEVDTVNRFGLLKPGDLLFFGPNNEKITHVAIYLGDQKFIHSDGWVHINSLNKRDSNFNLYRFKNLRKAKRILGE